MLFPVCGLSVDIPEGFAGGAPGPAGPAGPQGPPGVAGVAGLAGSGSAGQESGFWTPVIGGLNGESGQLYSTQRGYYVKTGKLVNLWCYTQFSNKGTITGPLALKGLPFPAAVVPMFFAGHCAYFSNLSPNAALVTAITFYVGGTLNYAGLFGVIPGSNPRGLDGNDINDHTQLILSLAYLVD